MSDGKDDNTELVNQILQLQSEASRKKEWLERLKEKKKTLEDELQERKQDVSTLEGGIQTLHRKDNEHKDRHNNKTDQAVNDHITKQVRSMLKSRIPTFKEDEGVDDESSDDDEDQDEEQPEADKTQVHDSVIVTYLNANTQDPNKLDEYRVSYRLDKGSGGENKGTTVSMLHEDACEYWGCSKGEYRLCQPNADWFDEIPESKWNDSVSKTLDRKKRAHLILANRTIIGIGTQWQSKANIDIEKYLAKQIEIDDAALTSMRHGKAQEAKEEDHFATAFTKWPGIYNLLKYKQKPLLKKWAHIKCRNFVMYGLLILLTGIAIYSRSHTQYYWLREGVFETIIEGVPKETSNSVLFPVLDFQKVKQYEDIWVWIRGSFHYQMFNNNSNLRQFYTPVTYLRARQMKAGQTNCRRGEIPLKQRGGPCYQVRVGTHQDDQDTATFITDPSYWIDTTTPAAYLGRLASPDPRDWSPTREDNIPLTASMQYAYDGSGYKVDYDVLNPNASSTFDADMQVFNQHWLNSQTRLFVLETTLANYNLGGYISCTFMFEISPSGAVLPTAHLMPIDIGVSSDGGTFGMVLLVVRGLILLYIVAVQVYCETTYKASIGKSGLQYIFSVIGLLDMCTVSIFAAIGYMRLKFAPPKPEGMTTFYSYSCDAWFYDQLLGIEGIFIVLTLARFISFLRLHPFVNQYWKMYGRACGMFYFWMALFVPVFLGFVMLAHCIWSPGLKEFNTWWQTTMSLIIFIKQDFDLRLMYEKNPTWTIPFVIFFFLGVSCFMVNGFLAITIHSYFQIQLTDGVVKEAKGWTSDQWMDWVLAGPVYKCVTGKKPGSSKRDDGADEGDGAEESSSEDEDDEKEN